MEAHQHSERVFDVANAHRLDSPERLLWLPPDEVLRLLPLRRGMTVADVGAGTGFFALPLARAIGEGKLFAVDLQPGMLELLRAKLADPGAPPNIVVMQGRADATSLPAVSCDLGFLANLWHELPDHPAVLTEMRRILKPNGTLAILDWRPGVDRPPGPPLEHRIAAAAVHRAIEARGWTCRPPLLVGRYSYLVLARQAG